MSFKILRVGQKIFGYCGGLFGNNYEDKIVEAIGADWVVLRGDTTYFYRGSPEYLLQYSSKESEVE